MKTLNFPGSDKFETETVSDVQEEVIRDLIKHSASFKEVKETCMKYEISPQVFRYYLNNEENN